MSALRILVWSSIPTHHQSEFLAALRASGVDLIVHYFMPVTADRLQLGWEAGERLPAGERQVPESLASLALCPDWRERIHVVPGYGRSFLLRLTRTLSSAGVSWVNWSEHAHPGLRSAAMYPLKRYFGHLVQRHALGALAIGELARRDFIAWGIAEEKIRFLPYASGGFRDAPMPPDRAAASPPHRAGVRFLFLGALCARKGIDLLLKAMRVVHLAHPDARLRLVGSDTSAGHYERLAMRLGLAQVASFSPPLPARQVGEVLRDCEVLILPSRHDGWGMVINEGASVGRALIGTDACGSAHHLIVPGVNGFRPRARDVGELSQAMLSYCADRTLASRHGAESRRLFADFTPERNAARFIAGLDSLIASRARPEVSRPRAA